MTPLMSLFLRCLAALLLIVVLLSLADYTMAATPVPGAAHDALEPFGPQAGHIAELWNVFMVACGVVFAAIVIAMLYAVWKAPRSGPATPADLSGVNAPEPATTRNVTRAVIASSLALVALVVASVFTDRALARMSLENAVNIEVTAHQWWWTARYINGGPSDVFVTANEMHVPVGRPVVVTLKADDVIHSLWLPSLAGKKDLIPGRTSVMRFQADRAGVYRGQCAEFCGMQHALMGLLVIADPPDKYQAWVRSQQAPAAEPADALAQHGRVLFQAMSCAMCHAVQGTLAQAQHAPDLTHVASRQSLAAGTLPNTPQHLAAWIMDPQKEKPGTNMPATPMSSDDLAALVAYVGGLR